MTISVTKTNLFTRVVRHIYIHYWKSSEFSIVRTRVTYSYHLDLKDGVIRIDSTFLL
jgi:hypothetical protein